ncbi:hypothetical protein GGR50DRAFT_666481 [Xylaria sp. CBS 124048]|nr:hypothetical protein GGR50DRAFT_666481 [Xylaria sp. CBS 124048]
MLPVLPILYIRWPVMQLLVWLSRRLVGFLLSRSNSGCFVSPEAFGYIRPLMQCCCIELGFHLLIARSDLTPNT